MNLRTNGIFKNIISKNDSCITLDDKQIQDLQKVLLEIMSDIIDVCNENHLSYSLSGGTLLGAVRHNGFIPWDDDADLDITRKDFYKFIDAFKDKYSDKYWVHIPGKTDEYGVLMTRVRKKGTVCKVSEDENNDENGIFVDIFIVENTYNNLILRKIHEFLCTLVLGVVSCRNFYKNRRSFLKMAEGHKNVLRLFRLKIFLGALISWIPVKTIVSFADKIFAMCKDDNSKMITIPAGRKKFSGELFMRSDYCEYIESSFEGYKWKIPAGYERILTRLYGDYMEIPPEDKREKHVLLDFKI